MKYYYVYIATNPQNNVFYTGVTNNLVRRIYEHKQKQVPGFTEKYNINKLVFYTQIASGPKDPRNDKGVV